jgi:hypothetical protein
MPTENLITEQPDEVKRYRFKGAAGEYVYAADFYAATRCFLDAAERCLAAERREQALQLRLNAADQRIDELVSALTRTHGRCEAFAEDERDIRITSVEVMRDIAARALGQHPAETERDQGIPGTSFQRLNMLANQGE